MSPVEANLLTFYKADRECRSVRPSALAYLSRALCLSRLGFSEASRTDLARSEQFGVRDLDVLRWILTHHSVLESRASAARLLLDLESSGRQDRDAALTVLFSGDERVILHAKRRRDQVEGWIAGFDPVAMSIQVKWAEDRDADMIVPVHRTALRGRSGAVVPFAFQADRELAAAVTGFAGAQQSRTHSICAAVSESKSRDHGLGDSPGLSIVIPVYADPPSLGECLSAIALQKAEGVPVIVIDDASPDNQIRMISERFCTEIGGHYHRSSINLGFAGAVNLGLSYCPTGDVLILNSDAVLPAGCLERLKAAAESSSDIGTVSPLSNDLGATGFPDPLCAGPVLSAEDRVAIDQAAQSANSQRIVDLLCTLGSCLYVTRRALNKVGQLSLVYGRGYYEDIEFYLRVSEAGLRNVAACDVYVSHRGGRSFGDEKRALVARNQAILRRRFPNFELQDIVFDYANPLRQVRARIEDKLRPDLGGVVMLVGQAAKCDFIVSTRSRFWHARERPVLAIRWRVVGQAVDIDLAVQEGSGPRSLRYNLTAAGVERASAYLAAFKDAEIEVFEPETTPSALVGVLQGLRRPFSLLVESESSAAFVTEEAGKPNDSAIFRGTSRKTRPRVTPLDRMAASALAKGEKGRTLQDPGIAAVERRRKGFEKLGISMPMGCAAAEYFLLSLARVLRRRVQSTIIVIGRAIDERQLMSPGNVWVTGPLLGDDPGVVARHYGVDALLSPYRASMFWHIDELKQTLGVPIAYFDWSNGRFATPPQDLALDVRQDDAGASLEVAAWCSGVSTSMMC